MTRKKITMRTETLLGVDSAIEACLRRMGSRKDVEYFREMLRDLIKNNAIPTALLEHVPVPAGECGKTRFDQLYDASMYLAFPGYRSETLERLLGPQDDPEIRIWRVLFPEKLRIAHVLIRARTFQEAFALGCDYACKVSLRLYRTIPSDLTVRVMFMSEKAIRRHLELRWANRVKKRKQLQLKGREFTPKQVNGARLAALGHPSHDPRRSIARYAEVRDLVRVREKAGLVRLSSVEAETQRKP